jgi:hypothetical protein
MTIRIDNPTKATAGGAATDHSTLANLTSATAGHTGYQATIISSNLTAIAPVAMSGGSVGSLLLATGITLSMAAATTAADGYLTTNRFDRFNKKHLRFSLIDPTTAYATTPAICIWASVDTAIYISGLRVDCNIDPATELTGDLKTADAWVGTANPVIISGFDTASGVTSLTNLTASIAATKCLYIQFDTAAQTTVKNIAFDITYIYT